MSAVRAPSLWQRRRCRTRCCLQLRERRVARQQVSLLYGLGSLALERADTVQASPLLTVSLTLRQEIGDTEGIAWSLSTLELVNVGQDAAHADALFTESIGLFKTLHVPTILHRRRAAEAALRPQDTTRAAALFAESLIYYRELGDGVAIQLVQDCLDGLICEPRANMIA
jgi:hypothetical protein